MWLFSETPSQAADRQTHDRWYKCLVQSKNCDKLCTFTFTHENTQIKGPCEKHSQYRSLQRRCSVQLMFSPWDPSSLHFIGHCDICGPNIVLPTLLSQHSSQDRTAVHSNTHVDISLGFLSDIPVVSSGSSSIRNKAGSTGVIIKLSRSLITTKEEKQETASLACHWTPSTRAQQCSGVWPTWWITIDLCLMTPRCYIMTIHKSQ